METADLKQYITLQPDFETALNPYGQGIELDVIPWLRFLPNETYRLLTFVRDAYHKVTKKLLADRRVCILCHINSSV